MSWIKCPYCNYETISSRALDEHIELSHEEVQEVQGRYMTGEGVKELRDKFVEKKPETFKCLYCDDIFPSASMLLAHQEGNLHKKQLVHFKHATGSKISHFEYIPLCALEDLANRFTLGHEIHGPKAYNALQNQEALDDIEWVKARLAHVIHHAYKALQDLVNNVETDGHAGAIMFGGSVLSAYYERKHRNEKIPSIQSTTEPL